MRVKEVAAADITARVAELCIQACTVLPPDVAAALSAARDREESQVGREVLARLLENAAIASEDGLPICQDTGIAVVFVELGEEVRITGGHFESAIVEGVRRGYGEGLLRESVVASPFDRRTTEGNVPPVIHTTVVPGDRLKIALAAKGAGSENMSRLRMMVPADGIESVKRFVLEVVGNAGASACPPLVIGIGLGGNFEHCALLSKRALLRKVDDKSPDPDAATLEQELLDLVNRTGIGPMALGGMTTALSVKVESAPCHIASLPVAVNLQCHAARHAEYTWE
jgi:fumarate hydratase subunit alpha